MKAMFQIQHKTY